ncbi:MAG: YdcF family protein [Armatimonadetes bacterium]|nr:YdcF family protein [Armatimonadota bacterium]
MKRPPAKGFRRALRLLGGALLAFALGAGLIFARVQHDGAPIYTNVSSVPAMPVAVVFGAAREVVQDRVQTGVDLYKAGKVRKLLLTGDNYRPGYNETDAMRRMAVAAGVPARDIVCDDAGLRTYDSLYRARDIFGVRRAILVTQRYHLPRALYLARHLGLEVVGMDAARHTYVGQPWFDVREVLAVEAAWLDVKTHRRPKFLSKRAPIFQEGA